METDMDARTDVHARKDLTEFEKFCLWMEAKGYVRKEGN
jgi:hypothetical protein